MSFLTSSFSPSRQKSFVRHTSPGVKRSLTPATNCLCSFSFSTFFCFSFSCFSLSACCARAIAPQVMRFVFDFVKQGHAQLHVNTQMRSNVKKNNAYDCTLLQYTSCCKVAKLHASAPQEHVSDLVKETRRLSSRHITR